MPKTLAERFAEKTRRDPATGCLIWKGALASDKSGIIKFKNRNETALRASFCLHHGRWPEHRVFITCPTMLCVEPTHIEERGIARIKPCRKCGSTDREPPREGTPLGNCRQCHINAEKIRYHADPDTSRALRRQRDYGISVEEQWRRFRAHDERCANKACRRRLTFRSAHLDHDHACCPKTPACGQCARSFLCGGCNVALGRAHDDPRILRGLADYMEQWQLAKEPVLWTGSLGATCSDVGPTGRP